jgi:hypothetical protein
VNTYTIFGHAIVTTAEPLQLASALMLCGLVALVAAGLAVALPVALYLECRAPRRRAVRRFRRR